MIIFLDEELAYLSWVTHHRAGFVLDCPRPPAKGRRVLHRAVCPEIKVSTSKRTHWTTGPHMKACSLEEEPLRAWAAKQGGSTLQNCPKCLANGAPQSEAPRLSHLDREVLSFVLEVTLLHLDQRDGAYLLTVGKTAHCLAKTPGQLNASLQRLIQAGLLTMDDQSPNGPPTTGSQIYPTVTAMRSLPAFKDLSNAEIALELAALTAPCLCQSRAKK